MKITSQSIFVKLVKLALSSGNIGIVLREKINWKWFDGNNNLAVKERCTFLHGAFIGMFFIQHKALLKALM